MSTSTVGRFWLALVLLLSSLSSAPMASMEQGVPDAGGQVGQGHPLPTVRTGTTIHLTDDSVEPERPASPRAPPPAAFVPAGAYLTPPSPVAADHLRIPGSGPDAVPPFCERLPYQPNAPPA
jgi:hypothetical protein